MVILSNGNGAYSNGALVTIEEYLVSAASDLANIAVANDKAQIALVVADGAVKIRMPGGDWTEV